VTGLAWLSTFLLLPLAGLPMLRHRSYGRFDFLSRAVLSGAAGASLVSFSMTVFALLGVRWQIPTIAATAALLAYGMGRLLPVKKANVAALSAESFGTIETIACGLVLLVVAAALIATVAGAAGSPDLLFFWGTKAQQFAAARTVDAGFLRETFHRYMHVPYPPLVTNLGALATMGAGRFPWRAAILTFPLLLAALALGLPGILRGSIGSPAAGAVPRRGGVVPGDAAAGSGPAPAAVRLGWFPPPGPAPRRSRRGPAALACLRAGVGLR